MSRASDVGHVYCSGIADHDRLEALRTEQVPEGRRVHRAGVVQRRGVVAPVPARAEAVDPELAGIPAGQHRRPGGDRDRRVDRVERAEAAPLAETAEHGEIVAKALEDELG
jgi:hypothetical protein